MNHDLIVECAVTRSFFFYYFYLLENLYNLVMKVELQGLDGYGCPLYTGSGCFHRREILCGSKYNKETKIEWKSKKDSKGEESLLDLEETSKALASCTYERNTQWGKEVSLSPSLKQFV